MPIDPLSAILWDVGGTLVDHLSGPEAALDRALRDAGIAPGSVPQEVRAPALRRWLDLEPRWRTLDDEAAGLFEIASVLAAGAPDRIYRLAARLGRTDLDYRPVPGIPKLLTELVRKGIPQAVVSNWPPSLSGFLRRLGLSRYFTLIVCSGAEGILKPDSALLACAIRRLGANPARSIFIGNDPECDIAPARTLGLRTIHFDPRRQYPGADAHDVTGLRGLMGLA